MRLTSSSACVKYLLFVFNLIFLITGIAILVVGCVVQSHYTKYDQLLDHRFLSVPSLLIATGVIILIVSFFGCCGAVKENHCMILTFSILLVLIFILELAAGIAGYILEDVAKDHISEQLNITMHNFEHDETTAIMWKGIQEEFGCCGIHSAADWGEVFNNTKLPMSCCSTNVSAIGNVDCTLNSLNVHKQGCLEALGDFVVKNAVALGGVGIGIGFVQLLGIVFACCLAHSIRKNYETV